MFTVLQPEIERPYCYVIAYSKDESKVSNVAELNFYTGRLAI
jgi:hypothetical protein